MMSRKKSSFLRVGFAFFCLTILFGAVHASAANLDIFFERRDSREIARGVTLETNRMVTHLGLLDVHVISIYVREPFIDLIPVASQEIGWREPASLLLDGAIAGINADFFGMAGSHTTHFGVMAAQGAVLSMNAYTNAPDSDDLFATFFLDIMGNAFFEYMHGDIRFSNGRTTLDIQLLNTAGEFLARPMAITRAGYTTDGLAYRNEGLTYIIVHQGVIIDITRSRSVVPADGFIIVLPHGFRHYADRFRLGDQVTLTVCSDLRVDFSRIQTAVGGGGLILRNGEVVFDDGVRPLGRHPRSAIGVTDAGRVILMAVDGRSHSIGVTHDELAQILRMYGVTNAMHLDGGGSTTLTASDFFGVQHVVNTPSEGVQRHVVNALGVFDNSPVGPLAGLGIWFESSVIGVAASARAQVFGVDAFGNRLPLPEGAVLHADPNAGFWRGRDYIPMRAGRHEVWVMYGGMSASMTIHAQNLSALSFVESESQLFMGEGRTFDMLGITEMGVSVSITAPASISVHPQNLGFFRDGRFYAATPGSGFIEGSVGDIRAFLPIRIVGEVGHAADFSFADTFVTFGGYPANVTGTLERNPHDRGTLHMSYGMRASSQTQAAHIEFSPAISLPLGANMIAIEVYGDGSGNWLRGVVRDNYGRSHNIDFVQHVNFTGWRRVSAAFPLDAPGPFRLDSVYMVSLRQDEPTTYRIQIRNLNAFFSPPLGPPPPPNTPFVDPLQLLQEAGVGTRHTFNVSRSSTYSARREGNFTVLTVAGTRGIFIAGREQWRNIWLDIARFNTSYILILLDTPPGGFFREMEAELLHKALADHASAGRLVFVVSPGEESVVVRDGVRYITVPGENAQIQFYVDGPRVRWGIESRN